MGKYIVGRIVYTVPSIIGVLVICFFLTRLSGDPAAVFLPYDATPEAREAFRHVHNLDGSLPEQFITFVLNLLKGDLGNSIRFQQPVVSLIWERLGATLKLALATLLIAVVIGIPVGIAAAYWRNSVADMISRMLVSIGLSVPSFYLGILSILIFSLWLRWLPASGSGTLAHLILPSTILSISIIAIIVRVMRSSMLGVLRQDYMRTARAKGLREPIVVLRHAVRNALLPVITVLAIQMGMLLGGVIVVETVFAWPGVGRLAVQAILARDYPVVQGIVLFFALVFVMVNLAADLSYALLDPRIRDR